MEELPIGDLQIKDEPKVVDVGIFHQIVGRTLFRSVALDVENVHTEVIMADFADKFMVIISQYPKLGTVFFVRRNFVASPQGKEAVYTTKVIFGAAGEEQYAAARYMCEMIPVDKPIILFLNLHRYNAPMLKSLKTLLNEFIYHEFCEEHDESEYRAYDPQNPCGVDLQSLTCKDFFAAEYDASSPESTDKTDTDEQI